LVTVVPRKPLAFDPIDAAAQQWVAHGWDTSATGMVAVTSVMRLQQLMLSRVDAALKPFALTFARYELLMLLSFSRTGALPLRVIGDRLQVHATSVTNLVDKLEEQAFITRRQHPQDRRATLAELTDTGRQTALSATEALNAEVFVNLGVADQDLTALAAIGRRFRQLAGDFSSSGV
jgi:DNA-binding MarR family transcriptional regulator